MWRLCCYWDGGSFSYSVATGSVVFKWNTRRLVFSSSPLNYRIVFILHLVLENMSFNSEYSGNYNVVPSLWRTNMVLLWSSDSQRLLICIALFYFLDILAGGLFVWFVKSSKYSAAGVNCNARCGCSLIPLIRRLVIGLELPSINEHLHKKIEGSSFYFLWTPIILNVILIRLKSPQATRTRWKVWGKRQYQSH